MGAIGSNGAGRRLRSEEWPTRRIALLVLPGIHWTSLAGPFDVFTRASLALSASGKRRTPAYEIQLLTVERSTLPLDAGLSLNGGVWWKDANPPFDTLLV